jgi:hypothetical protein
MKTYSVKSVNPTAKGYQIMLVDQTTKVIAVWRVTENMMQALLRKSFLNRAHQLKGAIISTDSLEIKAANSEYTKADGTVGVRIQACFELVDWIGLTIEADEAKMDKADMLGIMQIGFTQAAEKMLGMNIQRSAFASTNSNTKVEAIAEEIPATTMEASPF